MDERILKIYSKILKKQDLQKKAWKPFLLCKCKKIYIKNMALKIKNQLQLKDSIIIKLESKKILFERDHITSKLNWFKGSRDRGIHSPY